MFSSLPKIGVVAFVLTVLSLPVTAQTAPRAAKTKIPSLASLLGSWQGMTRMQRADEPMFTFTLKPKGVWTDLTFGEKYAKNAKYRYDAKSGTLVLLSAAGNPLYRLVWTAANQGEKERLVEKVKAEELYRAMVCYRYKPS
ncbi:MAG: hypothetical protein KY445_12520 [Armatimonadetes bacterium]|nr:hypothetical protein [Armatimonadota bacterium]